MEPDRIELSREDARSVLSVLAGFQGLLLGQIVTHDMLKGSAFRDLGIDRDDVTATATLAEVIEQSIDAIRREGI